MSEAASRSWKNSNRETTASARAREAVCEVEASKAAHLVLALPVSFFDGAEALVVTAEDGTEQAYEAAQGESFASDRLLFRIPIVKPCLYTFSLRAGGEERKLVGPVDLAESVAAAGGRTAQTASCAELVALLARRPDVTRDTGESLPTFRRLGSLSAEEGEEEEE